MTTPTIEELLDKARFEAWLRDRNPSAKVGVSGRICDCPFALYLRANGMLSAKVLAGGRNIELDDKRVQPPLWVQHFVTLVDQLRDSKGNARDHVKVRAYQAWAILGRIG